ncbi:hypothetical protein SGLAM104S_03783 [Streptomyces glaucescens]
MGVEGVLLFLRGLLGVLLALVAVVVLDAAVVLQLGEGRGVDLGLRAGLGDGLVDGGLEGLQVEDRVGFLQLGGLLGAELQVVRFLTGLGEGGDVHVVPADLLGEELHRVERRDDIELVRVARVGGVAGAGGQGSETEGGHRCGGYEVSSYVHESHFQQKWKRLSTKSSFGTGGIPIWFRGSPRR